MATEENNSNNSKPKNAYPFRLLKSRTNKGEVSKEASQQLLESQFHVVGSNRQGEPIKSLCLINFAKEFYKNSTNPRGVLDEGNEAFTKITFCAKYLLGKVEGENYWLVGKHESGVAAKFTGYNSTLCSIYLAEGGKGGQAFKEEKDEITKRLSDEAFYVSFLVNEFPVLKALASALDRNRTILEVANLQVDVAKSIDPDIDNKLDTLLTNLPKWQQTVAEKQNDDIKVEAMAVGVVGDPETFEESYPDLDNQEVLQTLSDLFDFKECKNGFLKFNATCLLVNSQMAPPVAFITDRKIPYSADKWQGWVAPDLSLDEAKGSSNWKGGSGGSNVTVEAETSVDRYNFVAERMGVSTEPANAKQFVDAVHQDPVKFLILQSLTLDQPIPQLVDLLLKDVVPSVNSRWVDVSVKPTLLPQESSTNGSLNGISNGTTNPLVNSLDSQVPLDTLINVTAEHFKLRGGRKELVEELANITHVLLQVTDEHTVGEYLDEVNKDASKQTRANIKLLASLDVAQAWDQLGDIKDVTKLLDTEFLLDLEAYLAEPVEEDLVAES